MSDREKVLGDVRAALAGTDTATVPIPRDYERSDGGAGSEHVLELLVNRLDVYEARVRRVPAGAAADAVGEALRARGAQRVVVPEGFEESWFPADGFERLSDDPPLSADELDHVDAVVTAATVAVADSGTVVLDGGPGQGRRALSLVPDAMVVVLRAEQVVSELTAGISRLDGSRPLTFVSGPSATVDIELVRVGGVHGPRDLDVIVLEERAGGGSAG